jgi:hypothetical protein
MHFKQRNSIAAMMRHGLELIASTALDWNSGAILITPPPSSSASASHGKKRKRKTGPPSSDNMWN